MVRLAFYKSRYGNFIDKIINWWTGGYGYSHCELVFTDGSSFSADSRTNKTRFTAGIDWNEEKWEFIDLPEYDSFGENLLKLKAVSIDGLGYDWTGIFFHQFLPLSWQSEDEWWCSEACLWLTDKHPYRVNPNVAAINLGLPRQGVDNE